MSYFALFCIKAALPNIAVRVFGFYPAVCLFFFFVCVSASVAGFTALFCISRLICLDAVLVYIIYWPLACYLSASVAVLCACKASVATYASLAVRLRTPRWRTSSFVLTVFFCFCFSQSSFYLKGLFSLCFFPDVFSGPMWTELNLVEDPSLRRLADNLPKIVLGSRADSTTLTYLNAFKRWRSWASRFSEITVLPATPVYVSLYLLSVLQASSTPAPVQTALYSIRWAHEIAGFESPTSHTLPQKVLESARRSFSHQTSKKLPVTPDVLLKFYQSLDGSLGRHKIHGHGSPCFCSVPKI